ncbi:putative (RS)-norcoclaurine 6-O-methyltransferase-like isoform 1 [Capsicum annuum]|nr:putative (RS)-norcoclaurine 6-O-methyltransferase-like isoform 1 [Capsicum annuum]
MNMEKGSMQSNLDCFLNCTTPLVPSQVLPKSEIRNLNRLWHPWEREKVEYFKLVDLWNCFDEWSAYGAGIPIRLDTGETLVQYYVPYLSAIQIFTSNSPANFLSYVELVKIWKGGDCPINAYAVMLSWSKFGKVVSWLLNGLGVAGKVASMEEAESVCEMRDSYSDSLSDESESEKLSRWDGCSSEEGGVAEQDSLSRTNDRLGFLYFQYFERCTPYGRVPLMDKINGLAERYPGLMSLRSVDLSPASWMAVAWYPIYHIPMGRTIKDLSTCFLTFHTLSSSFQDMDIDDDMENGSRKRKEGESISLPPFGLATYKMQGDVWISDSSGKDQEKLVSLFSVADSWLKQLGVQHHDFTYMSIRHG